ncbi:hypothetical protein [Brevibacillus brevis]|uniref:Uncharacterized protein n=1 Tax=Brevibacillus brevis TaxID=1393 RepID=A0A517I2W9_BREBE|nr:hypothetical protein [Brevibacillus brevis]QDS33184.1 hypothetical protein FPS98_03860 [Brevibacillus brevis]
MNEQSENRDAVKNVYILLTHTGSLLTNLIKQYTGAPYNHVSIAMDSRLDELYSFGRKQPHNPLTGGFIKENVYKGTYRQFPHTKCVLLRLAMTQRQWDKVNRVIGYIQKKANDYRYNFIGLFGVMMNVPIAPKNSYFCSQFVTEVLKRSGLPLWNRPSALITPDDFLQHASVQRIYEGRLYDYPLLRKEKLIDELHEMRGERMAW